MKRINIMSSEGDDGVPGGHNTEGTSAWAYHIWLECGVLYVDDPYGIFAWTGYRLYMREKYQYIVIDDWCSVRPGGQHE